MPILDTVHHIHLHTMKRETDKQQMSIAFSIIRCRRHCTGTQRGEIRLELQNISHYSPTMARLLDGITFFVPDGSLMRVRRVSRLCDTTVAQLPDVRANRPRSPVFSSRLHTTVPSGIMPTGRTLPTCSAATTRNITTQHTVNAAVLRVNQGHLLTSFSSTSSEKECLSSKIFIIWQTPSQQPYCFLKILEFLTGGLRYKTV